MEENNNVIQKFTLTKEGNEVLSFVRCDSEEIPEGYVPVTMSESSEEELMNGFSSAIGAAIPSAIVSQATSGLYQATVNPAMLMTLEDGTKSTAIMIDGRITGHAGFKPVSAKVFTPSIIFQVLSFFTGHYYLNGISKQLEALQVSINELRKDLEFEKQATLKAAYDRLKRLFVSSVNTIDELSLIQHIEYDMVDKYHFYLSKIEECNDAFIEKTKRVNKFRKDMIQAKAVIEESDELAYYRRMCLDAYRLIMISKLVYLKALASVSMYHKEFIPKITEVLNSLEKDNEDFIEKIYVSYLKRINLIDDSLKNANELQFAGYVVSSIMKQVKKIDVDSNFTDTKLSRALKFVQDLDYEVLDPRQRRKKEVIQHYQSQFNSIKDEIEAILLPINTEQDVLLSVKNGELRLYRLEKSN